MLCNPVIIDVGIPYCLSIPNTSAVKLGIYCLAVLVILGLGVSDWFIAIDALCADEGATDVIMTPGAAMHHYFILRMVPHLNLYSWDQPFFSHFSVSYTNWNWLKKTNTRRVPPGVSIYFRAKQSLASNQRLLAWSATKSQTIVLFFLVFVQDW